jgi:putative redox protein
MDVVSILRKKRQPVTAYEISVAGQQRPDHPAVFERIEVVHSFRGEIDREAVRRAIELSATRYCAVGGTLSSGVTRIHHSFVIRSGADVERGDVIWTGPFAPAPREVAAAG